MKRAKYEEWLKMWNFHVNIKEKQSLTIIELWFWNILQSVSPGVYSNDFLPEKIDCKLLCSNKFIQ